MVDRYLTSRSISSHLKPRYHAGLFLRPSVRSSLSFWYTQVALARPLNLQRGVARPLNAITPLIITRVSST
jgi:hypothetical protein